MKIVQNKIQNSHLEKVSLEILEWIDKKFYDRFFPVKIMVGFYENNIDICLFHRWIHRMTAEEFEAFNDYRKKMSNENGIRIGICGTASENGNEKLIILNSDWPQTLEDATSMPPVPYSMPCID